MPDSRVPLIIDTDLSMGELGSEIDDGLALAVAIDEPRVDLLAVSCVHGNTDVETVSALTRDYLQRAGREDIPVYPGAAAPLRRGVRSPASPTPSASAAHAELLARNGSAADAIDRLVRMRPGEVVVLAIGPLTNVAEVLARSPELAALIRELVVMGGVFQAQTGRADLPGEFNVWIDPDALAVVLRSGVRLRMVGLDVTERIRFGRAAARELAVAGGLAGELGRFTVAWIDRIRARRPGDARLDEGCALHDPLAFCAIVEPQLFDWRPAFLQVETESDLTRGVVIADLLAAAAPPSPNALIAVDVDVDAAVRFLTGGLGTLRGSLPVATRRLVE